MYAYMPIPPDWHASGKGDLVLIYTHVYPQNYSCTADKYLHKP